MSSVLLSGGSGLVGRHLCIRLQEKGYDVAILSRSKIQNTKIPSILWSLESFEIDREAINRFDYIIHLAGANIGAGRWTPKRRLALADSRVKSAQLILDNIDKHNKRLKAFISASAIGYYGAGTTDKIFHETDAPAGDFLGQICDQWEIAADKFTSLDVRTVKLRTGIVLSRKGGALSKLLIPVKLGLASAIGTGRQYMPWIHIDDLCTIYIQALENEEMNGAFNAVAPEHITNKAFTRKLARAVNKPFWFPKIPSFLLKLLFGEMSSMLLNGSRISSDKIQAAGYQFRFPQLDIALKDVFS